MAPYALPPYVFGLLAPGLETYLHNTMQNLRRHFPSHAARRRTRVRHNTQFPLRTCRRPDPDAMTFVGRLALSTGRATKTLPGGR